MLNLLIQSSDTKLLCNKKRQHDLAIKQFLKVDLVKLFLHVCLGKHFMVEAHWHMPPWQKVGPETQRPLSWLRKKRADLVLDTLGENKKITG